MNDFKILKKVKEYILFLESVLANFPKKDLLSKNVIYNVALDVLYCVLKANYSKDYQERREYQKEILVLLNMLDFYIERGFKHKYLSENGLKKNSNKLIELNKMMYGWIKSERVH